MKKKFSNRWKASKQPRKQKKYRANAPLSVKRKMLSANLSKDLRKKYQRRSFTLRKGDSVKIMRGAFKGKTGKVETVSIKKLKARVEGITKTKKDGTKVSVYFDPSNLQIKELILEDAKRMKAIKRNESKQESKPAEAEKEKTGFKKLPKSEKKEDKNVQEKK